MFTGAVFLTAKFGRGESINKQIGKLRYIHTHTMKYYIAVPIKELSVSR